MRNAKCGYTVLAMAVAGWSAGLAWGAEWTTVAKSGMAVPGAAGVPAVFESFFTPKVNRGGEVAFIANLQGAGVVAPRNRIVVWASGGELTRVARSADPFPGSAAGVYDNIAPSQFALNDSGEIAFLANEDSNQIISLLFGHYRNVRSVIRSSGPSTVIQGANYQLFWSPALVIPGEVTFFASGTRNTPSAGGGPLETLFRSSPGGPVVLADQFQQVPGNEPGMVFRSLSILFSQNANDTISFLGTVGPADRFAPRQQAIFYGKPGTLSARIVSTQSAPQAGEGVTYGTLPGLAVVDSADNLLYNARLAGPGVNTTNDGAIYFQPANGSEATLVAREGNIAPGTGARFSTLESIRFGMNGAVAISSTLVSPANATETDKAIFVGAPASLSLAVRTGDVLPGTGGGVSFQDIQLRSDASDSGTVLFSAILAGEGVSAANDLALLSYSPGKGIDLLLREGEPLAPTGGPLVQTFGDPAFSPTDVLALTVRFDDGSSALISTVIPEPSAIAVLGAAVIPILTRRRR